MELHIDRCWARLRFCGRAGNKTKEEAMTMHQQKKETSPMKTVLRVVAFVVSLAAIGLATRPFAQAMTSFYAVHAVMAAPFYALVVTLFMRWRVPMWSLCLASCVFGLAMGIMSPIMGASIMVPAFCSLLVWLVMRHADLEQRAAMCGAVFGGTCYMATVAAGAALGGFGFADGSRLLEASIMAVLGVALAILGSLVASAIAEKLGRTVV